MVAALLVLAAQPAGAAPPQPPANAYETAGTRAAWYELRLPTGEPRGIVLAFHGGGWLGVSPGLVRGLSAYRSGDLARRWRAKGFITVYSSYTAGEPGWTDVVAVYDQLHSRYPDLPIGAYGQSAGAHLALLLGAARPLAFVVSDAGPADWATWKSTYPCFLRNCGPVALVENAVGIGAWWIDTRLPQVFGAASDPPPNLNAYDVSPNYDETHGPSPFLIYGRRARTSDPFTQIPDGTPADAPSGNAYIDADNDANTTADQLEADNLVTQQQGVFLARRVGPRAVLRTLPKGLVAWVHGFVDGSTAATVYDEMVEWTAARAAEAPVAGGAKPNLGLPQLPGLPVGTYSVTSCNGAPGRSGVLSTGAWVPALPDVNELDASEAGCSTAGSAQTPVEGMQLRAQPAAAGSIAQDASVAMTFTAPPGTTITRYGAAYHGARASDAWDISLVARGASTPVTLAACAAGGPCATHANDLVAPGTTNATSGPYPAQTFDVPAGTTSLTWRLACKRLGGCEGGSSADPNHANQQAFVNVYAGAVFIEDPGDPVATLTGDFADGLPHRGGLVGAVQASDTGAGVRQIDVTFAGETQSLRLGCDHGRPRPCPAAHSLALARDTGALGEGPQPVTVTVVDGSGRTATSSGSVLVGDAPLAPIALPSSDPPLPPLADPFATGRGVQQLASCSTEPAPISYTLKARRLSVVAVVARRLAGATATLHAGARRVAGATVTADGQVRLMATLRSAELGGTFTVRAGGRASGRLPVRALVTLSARQTGRTVRLRGRVARGGGRRVQLQRLVACGRWSTLRAVRARRTGQFTAAVPAGRAPGGVYRARVVAGAGVARKLGSRVASRVAVT